MLFEADVDDLSRELPQGQAGELLVRGPWVIQALCLTVGDLPISQAESESTFLYL